MMEEILIKALQTLGLVIIFTLCLCFFVMILEILAMSINL